MNCRFLTLRIFFEGNPWYAEVEVSFHAGTVNHGGYEIFLADIFESFRVDVALYSGEFYDVWLFHVLSGVVLIVKKGAD